MRLAVFLAAALFLSACSLKPLTEPYGGQYTDEQSQAITAVTAASQLICQGVEGGVSAADKERIKAAFDLFGQLAERHVRADLLQAELQALIASEDMYVSVLAGALVAVSAYLPPKEMQPFLIDLVAQAARACGLVLTTTRTAEFTYAPR